jgi:hypothetical protein
MVAALAIGFTLSMPSGRARSRLAADAEMDWRPPSGNFAVLVSRGAARTLVAGAPGWGLSLLFMFSYGAALLIAVPAAVSGLLACPPARLRRRSDAPRGLPPDHWRPTPVRAAAFGDPATAAFGRAASP